MMYIPKYYEMKDYEEIKRFINAYNFATVVSIDGEQPVATHVPVNIYEDDKQLYVSGHLAKGNQQWRTLNNNKSILVIFQGPHGYVSSTWYENEDVPTWDYQSVHIYGEGQLLTHEALEADLAKLLDQYEAHREDGGTWNNLLDDTKQQIKGIVGFKIKVNDIQAAYKLSQNKSEKDYTTIVEHLAESDDEPEQQLADVIKDHRQS